jgi:iron(III) transport system ATP-binding protein
MTELVVSGLVAGYGRTRVLSGVDLTVEKGTVTAVLGPSGCGKTTLLRAVAGFVAAGAGTIRLGERIVADGRTNVPPERRAIGYVAQEGALFPHLSVAANVAFGLPRRERRDTARVAELLDLVSLDPALARSRPHQLSGGQQQRVALARALARRPGVVLLDEPFSSLDAGLRVATRNAVANVLARAEVTVVLVTHDQAEALSFADHVAVMRGGRIVQAGAPAEVYDHPADRETAAFLGEAVLLPGVARDGVVRCPLGDLAVAPAPAAAGGTPPAGGDVDVLLRPEQLRIRRPEPPLPDAVVVAATYFGHDALVELRLRAGGHTVVARVPGTDVPPSGSVVGVAVTGVARIYPGEASPA